jgi:hypothetical protein
MDSTLTTKEAAALFQTKHELERILRGNCGAYLPHSDYITGYHYRDLMSGDKLVST